MQQGWSWLPKPGRILLIAGVSLLLLLNSGCRTVPALSEKLPRPEIPAEYQAQVRPKKFDCQVSTQTGEPKTLVCIQVWENDFIGVLIERQMLRKALEEADRTLCVLNKECP